ncbi:MAG: cardiolipin synthase [Phycisphaerae bacterium]|nr:cardiolipin synthase [Phycisphaerae bacterium]
MGEFAWISWTLFGLDWLVRISLALRVILRRTPVPTTLAWLLVLLLVPVLGWVAYALVGENRLGSRRAARAQRLATEIMTHAAPLWTRGTQGFPDAMRPYEHLASLCSLSSGTPALSGNAVEIVSEWDPLIDALVRDIDGATRTVHLLFYIWGDAGRTADVADALVRASARGVKCRVLVDAVGSLDFVGSAMWERLGRAGVELVEALPVNPLRLLLARVDLRNHRKIAVIDARVAYAGSHNLVEPGFKQRGTRKLGLYVDATARLRGPAVQALQTAFLSDWLLDSDDEVTDVEKQLSDLLRLDEDSADVANGGGGGASIVHVVPTGPGMDPLAIHHALLATIHSAREELVMTTPYFVPDEATKAAIIVAARRGVAVTLVLPARSDHPIVCAAARSHYQDLLDAGVRIMHFTAGLLHSKTVTVDRRVALIMSANFDMRSFFLNYEVSLFIYDDDFASVLRFLQVSYIEQSTEVTRESWATRTLLRRFGDNVAQLLSPLL